MPSQSQQQVVGRETALLIDEDRQLRLDPREQPTARSAWPVPTTKTLRFLSSKSRPSAWPITACACRVGVPVGHDGEESAALRRALQPVDEAFAPAGVERLPVELALGLRVRRAATLDHHRRQHLAGEKLAEPEGDVTGRLRSDD